MKGTQDMDPMYYGLPIVFLNLVDFHFQIMQVDDAQEWQNFTLKVGCIYWEVQPLQLKNSKITQNNELTQ